MDPGDNIDAESQHLKTDKRTLFSVIESTGEDEALKLLDSRRPFSQDELNTALISACQRGYINLAYDLLHLGADVRARDRNRNTPLMICAGKGFINMARYLIRRNANINAANDCGDTALILTIGTAVSVEMVKLLLAQPGIHVSHQNREGYTALMKAAEAMDIDVIKLLLDAQKNAAEVLDKITNCRHETVQEIANKCGIGRVDKLLPDDGSNPFLAAVLACDVDSFNVLMDGQFCGSWSKKHIVQHCFQAVFRTHEISGDNFSEAKEKIIQRLLECGADVDKFPSICGPLVIATRVGSYNVFQMLLKHAVNLDLSNWRQEYLLTLSAEHGHAQIMELLLKHNPKLSKPNYTVRALHAAMNKGHKDCINVLTKHGVNIDVTTSVTSAVSSNDVVHLKFLVENFKVAIKRHFSVHAMSNFLVSAARSGNVDIIRLLIEVNCVSRRRHKKKPLMHAKKALAKLVNFLVQKGAVVNKSRKGNNQVYSPMNFVLPYYYQPYSSGKEKIVEALLKLRACVNGKSCGGRTPLLIAVSNKSSKDIVQVLLDHETDVAMTDSYGNNVLMIATDRNSTEIVECLLRHTQVRSMIDALNYDGLTALMIAVSNKSSKDIVQMLLDHEAHVTMTDSYGNNVLMIATDRNSTEIVECLLRHTQVRSMIDAQNYDGLTALMISIINRNQVTMKSLIDHGADVNVRDVGGNTALLFEVSKNKPDLGVLSSLIEAGSDVNCQNTSGYSSLMLSVKSCKKDVVKLLVDSGANVNAVSEKFENETALSLMLRDADFKSSCVEYLLDHGASASYLQPVVLLQLIQWRRMIIIPKLIRCGLRPAEIPLSTVPRYDVPEISTSCIVEKDIPTSVTESISPLAMAILTGNDKLASYFVGNLFVTQNDMFRLAHSQQVRQYLYIYGYRLCWLFLYKLTRKPLSLFSMAFLAVQSAVGPARGHEEISTLPLPQPLKDILAYKVETVPLETTVGTGILDGWPSYIVESVERVLCD